MPDIPRTNPLKRRSDRPVGPIPAVPPAARWDGELGTAGKGADRRLVTTFGEGVVVGVLVLFAALGFGAFVRFVLYLFGA